jgi:diacylglycerol kinase (CTP)
MEPINYSWDSEDNTLDEEESFIEGTTSAQKDPIAQSEDELPTRQSLQYARRLFHMANGGVIATLYWISFSHSQMVHALGTIACLLYVFEQIRINYPEAQQKFLPMTKFIIRAEEQLKESAMVPYAFAVLLTIITFPKPIALIAIYMLAFSDPLSAIIGIRFGKRRIVPHKSLEGSAAFFISSFIICLFVLGLYTGGLSGVVMLISLLVAFTTSAFEMLPLRIDDNLTIPLFSAFMLWIFCGTLGIVL